MFNRCVLQMHQGRMQDTVVHSFCLPDTIVCVDSFTFLKAKVMLYVEFKHGLKPGKYLLHENYIADRLFVILGEQHQNSQRHRRMCHSNRLFGWNTT